jgi:NAD(P)-dependent dehydrogenase (short-subunit alcohol dehydrogenase family)
MSLNKKVLLITGAAVNTGYAIAHRFASEGYDVCITSRSKTSTENALTHLQTEFPNVHIQGFTLNLEDVSDIKRVFSEVGDTHGQLDVFIPNAIHQAVGLSILNTTPEEFSSVVSVNFRGTFFCCQEAAKIMINQGFGSIIMMGSVLYKVAMRERALYSATKGAIVSLTKAMAIDLASYGIRVNCLVPGAIWTERWDSYSSEEIIRRRAGIPLGKEASGEDVANAAFYLASDQAANITGIELVVDAGVCAKISTGR